LRWAGPLALSLASVAIPGGFAACARAPVSSGFDSMDADQPAPTSTMGSGGVDAALPDASAGDAPLFQFYDAGQADANEGGNGLADAACDGDVCTQAPVAICGDGVINGTELCDDGNAVAGDGCSPSCRLEPGFACTRQMTMPNSVCHPTHCGDGVKEGFEQCDDGNVVPYDGCSPSCTVEAKCNGVGGCTGVCGDGLVIPPEQCDDGNAIDGDGCSSTCQLEPASGYSCTNVSSPPAAALDIPILYRDMLYHVSPTPLPVPAPTGGGHPDFNYDPFNVGRVLSLVFSPLAADSEPVLNSVGTPQVITDATSFCWWYHDKGCAGAGSVNPYAKPVSVDAAGKPMVLHLTQTAPGSSVYSYSNQFFFPIDGLGWNAGKNPQTSADCTTGTLHNFSFTSELHYVFTYDAAVAASANPTIFSFMGDDDVWAFINGLTVVDLGGMHTALPGMITLNTANAAGLGLVDGGFYAIDLFQAERHTCQSTYALTLGGFAHTVTTCKTACGDGIAAGTEQCDNGANNVPAGSMPYGRGVCTDQCQLAPYCGDGIVQKANGEKCDGTPDCQSDCQPVMAQ
jgi:fibro-slime domain-containing protein